MSYARPVVLGIFKNKDKILVAEGFDPATKQVFYRPLGGTIEFQEKSIEALRREIREELRTEIKNIKYLGTTENIFTYNNQPGHEIDIVYEAEFVDPKIYSQHKINGREGTEPIKALWLPIKKFKSKEFILYPVEIIKIIS